MRVVLRVTADGYVPAKAYDSHAFRCITLMGGRTLVAAPDFFDHNFADRRIMTARWVKLKEGRVLAEIHAACRWADVVGPQGLCLEAIRLGYVTAAVLIVHQGSYDADGAVREATRPALKRGAKLELLETFHIGDEAVEIWGKR